MTIFISALILGFIFNAMPGPVFAETLRHGMSSGFRGALSVQLGSLIGDASWAIIGLLGIGLLMQLDFLRIPLTTAACAYLIYLAWDAWKSANQILDLNKSQKTRNAFSAGAMLSLMNPQNIAYWAAVGGALSSLGIKHPLLADYALYLSGFLLASFLWCFICAYLVKLLVEKMSVAWRNFTYKLCAIALLFLALNQMRDLMSSLQIHKHPPSIIKPVQE